jgi:hypothetical protein
VTARALVIAGLLLAGSFAALAQDAPAVDEAHLRREVELDPAHALDELNAALKKAPDDRTRARVRLIRAIALARIGEKGDALRDLTVVLSQLVDEPTELEASKLVRELRGFDARLEGPRETVLPGEASVALVGSATGSLTVEWSLYRVVADRLRAELRAAPQKGLETHLRRPRPPLLERLDAWRETLDASGAFARRRALPRAREPGIYFLTASVEGAPVHATLSVARHGVLARLTARDSVAFVLDHETGRPVEGAVLERLGPDGLVPVGTTDARGACALDASALGELLAWSEGGLARLPLGVGPEERPGAPKEPLDLFLETPLVRPGETVRAVAVSIVGSRSTTVALRDPLGRELLEESIALDASGLGTVELPVPRTALAGRWTLASRGGSASFRVERSSGRAFEASFPDVPELVFAGAPLVAHVRARAAELPLAGAHATWRIRGRASSGSSVVASGEGTLDAEGELKVAHLFPADAPAADLVLEAEVSDAHGRVEGVATPLRLVAARLAVELEERDELPLAVEKGARVLWHVRVVDEMGKPARDVAVLVSSVTTRGGAVQQRFAREKPTERDGRVEVEVPFLELGTAMVAFSARDAAGRTASIEQRVLVGDATFAGETGRGLRLHVDRAHHRAGETATVFVELPSPTGWAILTKERGRVLWSAVERFEGSALRARVPLDGGDAPSCEISVATVSSGTVARAHAFVEVDRLEPSFTLETVLERAVLRPGEIPPLEVRALEGEKRRATEAELVLTVADARPFELLRETAESGRRALPAPGAWSAASGSPELLLETDRDETPETLRPPEILADDPALVREASQLELAPRAEGFFLGTGPEGVAPAGSLSIALDLPGTFRLGVVGASRGRAALASSTVRVEPELALELDVPPRVVEGDSGRIAATIARATDERDEGDIHVRFSPELLAIDSAPRIEGATIATGHDPEPGAVWLALKSPGRARLTWTARFPRAGDASLRVEARTEQAAVERRSSSSVLARGAPRRATVAGIVPAPPGGAAPKLPVTDAVRPDALRAELVIAPSAGAAARDAVAALGSLVEPEPEAIAARFVPALAAPSSASETCPEVAVSPAVVRASALELLELQRPDGAWPGSATAVALDALSIANAASSAVIVWPAIERGAAALERELPSLAPREAAYALLALAGTGPLPRRWLDELDARSDAIATGHGAGFGEAALTLGRALVASNDFERARRIALAVGRESPSPPDDLAILGAQLELLSELDLEPGRRDALARELLARREGVLWPTVRESALATRALLAYAGRDATTPPRELIVRVGKRELRRSKTGPPELPSLRLSLDGRALAAIGRGSDLVIEQSGGSGATYSLELAWTKLTSGLLPLDHGIAVKRRLGADETAPVLDLGSELAVEVKIETHSPFPLVLEEPLPAGATVVAWTAPEGTRVSPEPGRLVVVFPGENRFSRTFSYTLRGDRPGEWRALPSHAYVREHPSGEGESDEWRLRVRE